MSKSKLAIFFVWGLIVWFVFFAPPSNCEDAWTVSGVTSCYETKADDGDVDAQYMMATRYLGAEGVDPDEYKAVLWLKKAAINGHLDAQRRLGNAYSLGVGGVSESMEMAEHWWLKSANGGNIEAQLLLGEKYFEGDELDLDEKKSFDWFLRAASAGDHHAQMVVGDFYSSDRVIKKDMVLAYAWSLLAVKGGDPDSVDARDEHAAELSPEERKLAEKLAANRREGQPIKR